MTVDRYLPLFEEMGEAKVVKGLTSGQFSADKEEAAEFWLRHKMEERLDTHEGDRDSAIAEAHLLARKSLVLFQKMQRRSHINMYIALTALVLALLALFLRV
jgi:hypothetical protein